MTFPVQLWLSLFFIICSSNWKITLTYSHLTFCYSAFSHFSLFINHSLSFRKLRQSALLSEFPFQLLEGKHPMGTFSLISRSVPIHVYTMGLLLLSLLLLTPPLYSPSPRHYAYQSQRSWPSIFLVGSSTSQRNLRVKVD